MSKKVIIVGDMGAGSVSALSAIEELQNNGHKVVILNNSNDMKKEHLMKIGALAMFAESVQQEYPHISVNPKLDIDLGYLPTIPKRIPKGCKKWRIGQYEVIALNRKNAIRKALNLRSERIICDCGKLENEEFSPCCSFECWHKKFN